jgi:hypothetical protein
MGEKKNIGKAHHFNVHGVARSEWERVLDVGAIRLLVLGHAGGVLGEAFRVDEAIELLAEGRQGHGDVLRVTRHADIFDNICKDKQLNLK